MGSATSKSTLLLLERSAVATERAADAAEKQAEALDKLATWTEISVMIAKGDDLSKMFMIQGSPKELYNKKGNLVSATV
jgi:hypothetical protein